MLETVIGEVVGKRSSWGSTTPASAANESLAKGIPTLQDGVYRPCSPMLKQRFEQFGRWREASHGHWLSLDDMQSLWRADLDDEWLQEIALQRRAGEEDWPNEASALFQHHRLSLFAGSDIGNEKIYLLWLDFEEEPQLWVYDANGESRYANLHEYLLAYLSDDVSASERSWLTT